MLGALIKNNYGSKKGFVRYHYDDLIYKLGMYKHSMPAVGDINRVIFVCQGNICRSALAEAVFRQKSAIMTGSIGLNTTTGKPANPRLMKIARARTGIDLSSHLTKSIDEFTEEPGDVFVCMEINQLKCIGEKKYDSPCLLLGAFGEITQPRINDPFSANDTFMEKTIDDIVYHTVELAKSLKR